MARAALIATVVCLLLVSATIPVAWSQSTDSHSQGGSGLLFSVSANKRVYITGEAIGIRLVLINPTLTNLSLGFADGRCVDYEILCNGGVLYRWSDHMFWPAWAWVLTMEPLEVIEVSFVHEASDYSLRPGVYQVRGSVRKYAEAYASFVIADALPSVALQSFSTTLGAGLVAVLVLLTGHILTRRPAPKQARRRSVKERANSTLCQPGELHENKNTWRSLEARCPERSPPAQRQDGYSVNLVLDSKKKHVDEEVEKRHASQV